MTATMLRFTAVAAVLLGSVPAASQEPPSSTPLLRLEYFHSQRAYPLERVPAGALQRAARQYRARWPAAASGLAPAAIGDPDHGRWSAIGPLNIDGRDAGRISTIAVHPYDPATLYIGAAQGGVWKTTDGGASWRPLTDRACSLAMGSLALDPVNPDIVYAGTGELHFSGDSYYGCGVLRSTDAGESWTHLGGSIFDTDAGGARISKVIVDPVSAGSTTSTTVFVASNMGVYRSHDAGTSWTRVLEGAAVDMAIDPSDARTLFAAIGLPAGNDANGVYRSRDGGTTWTRLAGGLPENDVGRIALAVAPSTPNTLYAAVQDAFTGTVTNGQLLGIWRTRDGGTSWERLDARRASCSTQCWYDLVIAVDPLDPELVYFGGIALYRSRDGGRTFTSISKDGLHVDQHAIVFDPRDPATVYVGNDGGIYRSTDQGESWESRNTNLAITQFYAGIAPHPYIATAVIGGTQDNGTLEYAGAPTWTNVLNGDGGYAAIDHGEPDIAYAETQWTVGSVFAGPRRRDGAGEFVRKVAGIASSERALFIPPLVMDATDTRVLYFGTTRLYRTMDRGDSWTAIEAGFGREGDAVVSAIAPAPSDPATVWVGTNDGTVRVTTDGGATWTDHTGSLPARFVTDIAVDHRDPRSAVLAVSGFGTPHVFVTTDGGASWIDRSAGLPDMPVNAVLVHPALGTDIYIGTDLGVFRSRDDGRSWQPLADGLPNVAVFDLAYRNETGLIFAATHGRGVYALAPAVAASVTLTTTDISFDALGDTSRLAVRVTDDAGVDVADPPITWRSLDTAVVAVDRSGLLRSRSNGATRVVASLAGRRDTLAVMIAQAASAVSGLPGNTAVVVGETRTLQAQVVDRLGAPVGGAILTWMSADPTIATVDADGGVRGVRAGTTTIAAASGALADSATVQVHPPAVVVLSIAPAPPPPEPSSRAGTRLALLDVRLRVDGFEAVRVTRLGFELSGVDPAATALLVEDHNGDGIAAPDEPVVGAATVALRKDAPELIRMPLEAFEVAGNDSTRVLLALVMSGAAPNGTRFAARFIPDETAAANSRSGLVGSIEQPAAPVAGTPVRTTLLSDDAALSLSENPVRSTRVVFNFRTPPTRAAVYTLTGRRVASLTDGVETAASIAWELRNDRGEAVAPGVYLVVFELDGRIYREKLIVLRPATDDPEHRPQVAAHRTAGSRRAARAPTPPRAQTPR